MAATAAKPTLDTLSWEKVGENVLVARVGDDLIIKIDATHRHDAKPDGKTIRVASTLGNKELDETAGDDGLNVVIGINAYTYRAHK